MEYTEPEPSSMDLERRLNDALTRAMADLQGDLMKLQKNFHQCALRCFDMFKTTEQVGRCVEQCGLPVSNSDAAVRNEVAKFQDRIQRTVMDCKDKVQELRESSNLSDAELMKTGVDCVEHAVQQHIQVGIPKLKERVRKHLKSNIRE